MTFGRRSRTLRRINYKDVVRLCREKIRRVKAQLELSLATAIKEN